MAARYEQVVVVPTLDPTWHIVTLVQELRCAGFDCIVVVDDGSTCLAADPIFTSVERKGGIVLHHPVNLGKGSAIKTAVSRIPALFPSAPAFVTVDGDGQHLVSDVVAVCERFNDDPSSIVLGVRNLLSKDVPARSRFGNAFSALFFRIDTGRSCPDTQTGLRCIPMALSSQVLHTPGARYDFEMNFLTAMAKQGCAIQMVPITTVYHDNNAGSHFRTVVDSLRIYRQFLRFAGSSLACSAADLGIFVLLAAVLSLQTAAVVAVATAVARILSGALNFTLNRSFSFSARQGNAHVQASRYGLLFVAQMLLSMLFVTLLSVLPLPLVVVKMIVDGALFFASYFVQRNWVFASGQDQAAASSPQQLHHQERRLSAINRAATNNAG